MLIVQFVEVCRTEKFTATPRKTRELQQGNNKYEEKLFPKIEMVVKNYHTMSLA